MNQDRNIHDRGLDLNNRRSGLGPINRHPGLDPGSILISTSPTQKWIPDRASLVRNDRGLI